MIIPVKFHTWTCLNFVDRKDSYYPWNFDPSDGYDFVGVASHEMAQAPGFVSGVDFLNDNVGAGNESEFWAAYNPLDLIIRGIRRK